MAKFTVLELQEVQSIRIFKHEIEAESLDEAYSLVKTPEYRSPENRTLIRSHFQEGWDENPDYYESMFEVTEVKDFTQKHHEKRLVETSSGPVYEYCDGFTEKAYDALDCLFVGYMGDKAACILPNTN